MTRKEQRKADRQGRKQPSHQAYHDVSASEDEQSEDDQPAGPPPKLSKKAQGKRRADTEEEEKPKKKRKLPELTLPGAKEDDVEDQEIEWLEYMLRKEKEKAKDDDLDDGLDGELLINATELTYRYPRIRRYNRAWRQRSEQGG